MGAGDAGTLAFITETYQRADGFLFGRRTYDLFAAYWGAMDRGSHPIADALNTTPQLPRLDHDHRSTMGGHDRALR
jgi:hypothetical protein